MNKGFFTLIILAITLGMLSCQKDLSVEDYEPGRFPTPTPTSYFAKGSLQDNSGNNLSVVVNGSYTLGEVLTTSNTITVTVDITTAGKYKIHTDTVNGCWFSMDSVVASNTGIQTVTLQGYGRPLTTDTVTFKLHFLNSVSSFALITGEDYLPLTAGTYWTYDTGVNPGLKDTVRYTVTNQSQIINNLKYILTTSTNKDTEYYRKDTLGQYDRYFNQLSSYGLVFDYKILDETLPTQTPWATPNQTVYNVPTFGTITVYLQCQIIDKNITYPNKQGNTFTNVIHVQETLYIPGTPPYAPFINFDAYYAKGIGLVEYDMPYLPSPIYLSLKRWHIQ